MIEKDVFSFNIKKNGSSIKILKKYIDHLDTNKKKRSIKKKLKKLLREQKRIKKEWDIFSGSWTKEDFDKKLKRKSKTRKESCFSCL